MATQLGDFTMDAGTAALLALDGFGHHYHVTVSEPSMSDEGEMGNPAQLDEEDFASKQAAIEYCNLQAVRGLRACLYEDHNFIGEFE